jgi:hypothetical protein
MEQPRHMTGDVAPSEAVATAASGPPLSDTMRSGLALLLQAHRYAKDVERGDWDFAVEIRNLRGVGLNESDLRWLVCRRFVEHAEEITPTGDECRRFRRPGGLTFKHSTCLVLTAAGVRYAADVLSDNAAARPVEKCPPPSEYKPAAEHRLEVPHWDAERHELRLGNKLVKQFKHQARNQERILAAFQEQNWKGPLDDPLPPDRDIDSKRRLNDAIKCLNHHQINKLIRFHGDGTGEGIRWDRVNGSDSDP